jgi:hypothetical protein
MSSQDTESLAETFAARGREELVSRFRDAYAKAAGTHADFVSLDPERIEAMVQRSASEADGLQWRRALAGVAARELNIELGTPWSSGPTSSPAHRRMSRRWPSSPCRPRRFRPRWRRPPRPR